MSGSRHSWKPVSTKEAEFTSELVLTHNLESRTPARFTCAILNGGLLFALGATFLTAAAFPSLIDDFLPGVGCCEPPSSPPQLPPPPPSPAPPPPPWPPCPSPPPLPPKPRPPPRPSRPPRPLPPQPPSWPPSSPPPPSPSPKPFPPHPPGLPLQLAAVPPATSPVGFVLDRLNKRYFSGRPSNSLGETGVLVHVMDGGVDAMHVWRPGSGRDYLSASIFNTIKVPHGLYSSGTVLILAPTSKLRCSYPQGPRARAHDAQCACARLLTDLF